MADRWQTYTVEFKDGLITDLAPLQQGVSYPGSARILTNFEPAVSGGYRRIEGFSKFDNDYVPVYGEPLVQGSGQSGSTLIISDICHKPSDGDTFTIAGVTGTYEISPLGVTFDEASKTATLIFLPVPAGILTTVLILISPFFLFIIYNFI